MSSQNIPQDLKYTDEHEWVSIEEDDIVTVGITDYAQNELGDIVFVELPEVGEAFGQTDVFGTIEAVKTVADLFCPVAGKVLEINATLEDTPELVNADPYGDGWMIRLKITDASELEKLLSNEEYEKLIS